MAPPSVSFPAMTGNPQSKDTKPVIVIAGPTASGKSGAALAVAREFGGTVINADSMQVYADLRILTARPTEADEAAAPHRLYGVLPASERCTVARWREMALAAVHEAVEAGQLPIVCGGTGLYIKALMEGLSPVPEIGEAAMTRYRAMLDLKGTAALHARLAEAGDPMADRLEAADRQRVLRAFAVREETGRSLAEWQDMPGEGPPMGLRFETVLFDPPRQMLYDACNGRLEKMVADGALGEVAALMDRGVDPELPAMKALGMPQLMGHLRGEVELAAAVAAVQQATRRYAKRQVTWFRNQMISNLTIAEQLSERSVDKIFSFIVKKRLTRQV